MSEAPDPHDPPGLQPHRAGIARAAGAPREGGAVPRMETVRITKPDLLRRAQLEKMRGRLVLASAGFAMLFGAVVVKLTLATVLDPLPLPPGRQPVAIKVVEQTPQQEADNLLPHATRAMITDRNGEILAISLPNSSLYANPREMIDPADAAMKIKRVLPRLDENELKARLTSGKQFVYLARQLTPREQLAINNLGIAGTYFESAEKRRYPLGHIAAQVLGGVDVDGNGVAGAERAFDKRLRDDFAPLRLSIDVRVQAVMAEELQAAMTEFQAIGACGIVMDVNTGEVIAMVSLPDYDANDFGTLKLAPGEDREKDPRFNRALTGMFEPGSTFKLQTAAMALDSGAAHIWDIFDATNPIHVGRFTITDFEGKHRPLYLPEVLAYSSNLGAAHIATVVGAERQRAWLRGMGMFQRVGIELPEAGQPIVPSLQSWKDLTTMTVGFGHGIAVSPLHVVRGTAAIANGGVVLHPTILALAPGAAPDGTRVMQQSTSDIMRKLMRLVVTSGYGKPAEVKGYFVGGKTGTAEKIGAHGYKKHTNVSAFVSVFPMQAPRYAVYFMLDEPKGNASTGGFSTAGAVSAPGAGRVIARIGPMLGLFPAEPEAQPAIEAALSIPLEPGRPPGARTPQPAPPVASVTAPKPFPTLIPPRALHTDATPAAPRGPHPESTPIPAMAAPTTQAVAMPMAMPVNAVR